MITQSVSETVSLPLDSALLAHLQKDPVLIRPQAFLPIDPQRLKLLLDMHARFVSLGIPMVDYSTTQLPNTSTVIEVNDLFYFGMKGCMISVYVRYQGKNILSHQRQRFGNIEELSDGIARRISSVLIQSATFSSLI
jgi:hypothetical protein